MNFNSALAVNMAILVQPSVYKVLKEQRDALDDKVIMTNKEEAHWQLFVLCLVLNCLDFIEENDLKPGDEHWDELIESLVRLLDYANYNRGEITAKTLADSIQKGSFLYDQDTLTCYTEDGTKEISRKIMNTIMEGLFQSLQSVWGDIVADEPVDCEHLGICMRNAFNPPKMTRVNGKVVLSTVSLVPRDGGGHGNGTVDIDL